MNRRARTVSEGDSWSTQMSSSAPKQNQPYAGRHSAGGGGNATAGSGSGSGSSNFGRKRTTSSGSGQFVVSVPKKSEKPKKADNAAATTAMLNEVSAKISRAAVSKWIVLAATLIWNKSSKNIKEKWFFLWKLGCVLISLADFYDEKNLEKNVEKWIMYLCWSALGFNVCQ